MRVLILVNRCQRRGAEIFGFDLRNELRRRGHESRLVALYGQADAISRHLVDVPLEGDPSRLTERLVGFNPALFLRLLSEVQAFRPDIVQVHGARTVKYGSLLKRVDRSRRWCLVYRNIGDPNVWIGSALRSHIFRSLVVSQMDGIVSVSRATMAGLVTLYRPTAPVVQIPRGIDFDRLKPARSRDRVRGELGVPAESGVVLFVGSLSHEKRPDRFLRVVSQIASDGLPIEGWILGDGPLRSQVREAVETSVDVTFRLLGAREQLGDFYSAADVLLLTSDTEGMPGVLIEAGGLGVPAVATRVGGTEECIVHGVTGFVHEAEDESGLAESVRCLLLGQERRRTMSRQAERHVRSRFSIEEIGRRYLSLYEQLLSKGHLEERIVV